MGAAAFLAPMLAAPATNSTGSGLRGLLGPEGAENWLLEPKLDGLRCIAVRNSGQVELWSRNRLPFGARFPAIARRVLELPPGDYVLDGEIVGVSDGRADFGALQGGSVGTVEYWVFDLLWLLGHDLRSLPIEERKQLLAQLVHADGPLRLVPTLGGSPSEALELTCRQGGEGLVAKRRGSAYREGRSGDWLKLKCGCRQELVVGGYSRPKGSRVGFGALLLGYWQGAELRYAGKVGTGFSERALSELSRELLSLERPTSPFCGPVREPGARWVEPTLVAEVAFSNWTAEGRLRHPSFVGTRPDKDPREVAREPCGPAPAVWRRPARGRPGR